MKFKGFKHLLLAGSMAMALQGFQLPEKAGWQSRFVTVATNGGLTYTPDAQGNTIPDFSRVGYHQGNRAIPAVAVKKNHPPGGGRQQPGHHSTSHR